MITIQELRSMDKKEFAKVIRKLNKEGMKQILNNYGIYVPSKLKTDEVLDMLFDVVDGLISPTEKDAKKIEASEKRRANSVRLTKEDKELIEEVEMFIRISEYDLEDKSLSIEDWKKQLRNYYKKLHPDTCSKGILKYKKRLFYELNEFSDGVIESVKRHWKVMDIICDNK